MIKLFNIHKVLIISFSLLLFVGAKAENASKKPFDLVDLKTEYATTPLGVDNTVPRFSWRMVMPVNKREGWQKTYRIIVKDDAGNIVWDSGTVAKSISLNIAYSGEKLKPQTRYDWIVRVVNQNGKSAEANSWFETGLMNPSVSAWGNAKWIGGNADQLPFYSPYLEVFRLGFTFQMDKETNTKKASFIFGANDSRLLDKNKNILNVESKRNETYIRLEFDFSNVNSTKDSTALLNIYRVGYAPKDSKEVPFRSFKLPASLINMNNLYEPHAVNLQMVTGLLTLSIDGNKYEMPKEASPSPFLSSAVNLNPMGWGGDFICFPMLDEMGFAVDAGKAVRFSQLTVSNYREPSHPIFQENLSDSKTYQGAFSSFLNKGLSIENNTYVVDGGEKGAFVVADPSRNAEPMLRSVFEVAGKKIAKARLYITARGIYEAYINGQRIGNDYFNPGLTQYDKHQLYQVYDVTSNLQTGKNAIGVMLSEGWWSGSISFIPAKWNYFGDRSSLLLKLVVTYSDGSQKVVDSTPDTWRYYSDGPVRCGSFFQGEAYDARKEAAVSNWTEPSYVDSHWTNATEIPTVGTTHRKGDQVMFGGLKLMEMNPLQDYDNVQLIGNVGPNVHVIKELTPVSVEEVRPGVFVYDLGQNIVGFSRIKITGQSGQRITVRYAEMKYPDLPEYSQNKGMILVENLRSALVEDFYTLKGGSAETFQPRFTSHGFRYIEVTGIDKALPLEAVTGIAISSVSNLASSYESSNPDVNKLWKNITWSMRDNFVSIPTDCPQRNERMGWSGDISVFSRTATFLANMPSFLSRHILALRDGQTEEGRFNDVAPIGGGFGGILWGSAGITVPWESYQQYDDTEMLSEHYSAMKKYIDYLSQKSNFKDGRFFNSLLGDWLSPEGSSMGPNNVNGLIWDIYYYYDLTLMSKVAKVLGQNEDNIAFSKMAEERKVLFNKTYIDPTTKQIIDPETKQALNMQAPYAIALALGIVDEDVKPLVAKHFATLVAQENKDSKGDVYPAYSLMTGFIGTTWISKALSDNGYSDEAYRLLQQTAYPSWLYSVKQGATTIWERLNSYTVENGFGGNNSMNSFNHYSFGSVGAWLYNYSLGIQRDENSPAFKHFILQPHPDPDRVMTFAKGYYDSFYGRIQSGWKIMPENKLVYDATVPANTTAELILPTNNVKTITESGKSVLKSKGVKFLKNENGNAYFELSAGNYHFETEYK